MMSTSFKRWDWYTAGLLVAIVFTAAARLSVTEWTGGLGYVETVVMLGTALGLALGTSRFGRQLVFWLIFDYAMVLLPWQLMGMVSGDMSVLERLAITGARLNFTFGQLMAAKRIDDPIFFVTLMILLFWIISMYSAYSLMRSGTLLNVLVLPTVAMLIIQYYDPYEISNRIWILAFYFIMVLLLMGRVNILRSREAWQARRVLTGSEPEFDLAVSILVAAVALVIVAWLTPTPAAAIPAAARLWQDINKPMDAARTRINNMFAALESGSRSPGEVFGNSLNLGVNATQGTDPVFTVMPPPLNVSRYYWRMRVYDTYEAGNWRISTGFNEDTTGERADLTVPESAYAAASIFTFSWKTSPTILMALPSQPVWMSRAGQVQLVDAGPNLVDVTSWHTGAALLAGDQYTAHAIVVDPDAPTLRAAGSDYPDWVKLRYLQIPQDLSQDILNLSAQLTRKQPTPYDKASAVTEYLRQNINYSLSVPSVPSGVDPLQWFLFTWKSGFCNYYASAEVVLLRAAGVPARLAVGYSQGQPQGNGSFVVLERDSHAWPEVYFPGIGWVNFEPTTSQPDIVRLGENHGQSPPPAHPTAGPNVPLPAKKLEEDQGTPNTPTNIPYRSYGVWVIIFIMVSAGGYALWRLDQSKVLGRFIPPLVRRVFSRLGLNMPAWMERWERWSELSDVERSFQAINQSLAWLGKPQPLYATPAERAEQLKVLLPSAAYEVDVLAEQLERTLFGRNPGNPLKAARAAWKIRTRTMRAILQRWPILGAKR